MWTRKSGRWKLRLSDLLARLSAVGGERGSLPFELPAATVTRLTNEGDRREVFFLGFASTRSL
jgi:hypothetical protein